MDISLLLSTELVPWVKSTATVGVLAGATYGAINWAIQTWQRMPLIDYSTEFGRDANYENWSAVLRVTVLNRAPAPLSVEFIRVLAPSKTRIHANVGNIPFETIAHWPRGSVNAYVPAAAQFPQTSETFVLSWPDEGEEVCLQVMMRSHHQRIFAWRSKFTIKLPNKAKPK